MKLSRRSFTYHALAGVVAASAYLATTVPAHVQALSPAEARQIAEDAYIYGYSLTTTEVTRVQMSNVPKVEVLRAPTESVHQRPAISAGRLSRRFRTQCGHAVFIGWLDLAEPQVFSHPDMGDRYYLFEIVDLWMSD